VSSTKHHSGANYGRPDKLPASNIGAHESHAELHEADLVFQAFNAIGVIAFAYAAHNVVLDIQTELPSPSEKAMMKGVKFTYLVVTLCYFPMAIAVYSVYGNQVSQNALGFMVDNVSRGWVITTNIMLITHLIGSYQVTHSTRIFESFVSCIQQTSIYSCHLEALTYELCCFS